MQEPDDDVAAMAGRYARRAALAGLYGPLRPEVMQARHERLRVLAALLRRHARAPLGELRLLEVGCGQGGNLLDLIGLGFEPAHLLANELLPERAAAARARLPTAVRVLPGDALALPLPDAGLDLILQSTVFSSLLDPGFRARLAARLWAWLKPGGAVIWYDFAVGNPRNPDVAGMPLAELRRLFPAASIDARRVTLAPPLARRAAALHPALPALLNTVPLLRTHRLAWIAKPDA
ncbi:MAG: methyltransferase domain-containing protein [Ideonella sp. WA131b]|jgi:SAM-dependent methyltransferase|nr:methyltransferase domain-containing protein [Ideonella sp. WA131b]